MAEGLVTVDPLWALMGAALLGLFVVLAATLDGVLAARVVGSPGGARTPLAEAARLLRQRRRRTLSADRLLWRTGAAGLLVSALFMVTVVPLGRWTVFDHPVGITWFNTVDVFVWAWFWLAGWGANSAHSLVGGYRFLAQALAYELPLMFALLSPAAAAESLNVGVVAQAQDGVWFAVWMPVAFVVYCVGVVAFAAWGPFAAPLSADTAGGVAVELSGADRLVLEVGRYAMLAAGAAFAVPTFLGGGSGPLLADWAWVLVKTGVLLAALVWLRRRLPVVRPDKFMEFGWMVLLPATLVQVFVVAAVVAAGRG